MTSPIEHYTYRVTWSEQDEAYVASVLEFPAVSWIDADRDRALHCVQVVLRDTIEDLTASGEVVPDPLGEQTYTGEVQVHLHPDEHRRLAIQAAEQGVSLHQLVTTRLVD